MMPETPNRAAKSGKKLAAEVMANVLGQHYFSELWHNGPAG